MPVKGRPRKHAAGATQASPCTGYDFRQWTEHTGEDAYTFWSAIEGHFRKVTWQLEKSPENGHLHWQGRGVLWKKIRTDSAEKTQLA